MNVWGNAAIYKWLCAPKGSAFLYARRALQPLVVSWGYERDSPSGSQFVDDHEWHVTRDMTACLATPAANDFQAEHACRVEVPLYRCNAMSLRRVSRQGCNTRADTAVLVAGVERLLA